MPYRYRDDLYMYKLVCGCDRCGPPGLVEDADKIACWLHGWQKVAGFGISILRLRAAWPRSVRRKTPLPPLKAAALALRRARTTTVKGYCRHGFR
jgi:hypothetical protein